jgi:hypothetical protein
MSRSDSFDECPASFFDFVDAEDRSSLTNQWLTNKIRRAKPAMSRELRGGRMPGFIFRLDR